MKEMCTRNELNLILQAMTQAYQAVYGANVVKIILYGSYARGDYNKQSDVDIMILTDLSFEEIEEYRDRISKGFRYRYSRYCTGR